MPFEVDQDQLFLDEAISLLNDIYQLAGETEQISDDPAVLGRQAEIKLKAVQIWQKYRDYRPRLVDLRKLEANGPPEEIKKGRVGTALKTGGR